MSYPVWMKNNSGTRFIGSTYHYYRNMPYGYDSKCYLRVLTESQIAAEGAVHKAIKIPCKTAGKVSLSARFAEWPDTTSGADAVTHATAALTNGDWVSQKTILGDELGLAYRWAQIVSFRSVATGQEDGLEISASFEEPWVGASMWEKYKGPLTTRIAKVLEKRTSADTVAFLLLPEQSKSGYLDFLFRQGYLKPFIRAAQNLAEVFQYSENIETQCPPGSFNYECSSYKGYGGMSGEPMVELNSLYLTVTVKNGTEMVLRSVNSFGFSGLVGFDLPEGGVTTTAFQHR